MTCPCPPPVDWLDYIEGAGGSAMTRHLEDCGSCRAVLDQITPEQRATTTWAERFRFRTDAVWSEDRPAKPGAAEFWFSAASFDMNKTFISFDVPLHDEFSYRDVDRTLVLIIDTDETLDSGWLDVVPVVSDIEAATDTDLIFTADENTLGAPWRAIFSHQCKISSAQLDTRVGALTDIGAHALAEALAGTAADKHWGSALQGPDDPRGRLGERFEQALVRLRTPWFLVTEAAGRQQSSGRQPADDLAPEPHDAGAKILWLHPAAPNEESYEYPLAAASSAIPAASLWVLDTERLKLRGKLEVDYQQGLLLFLITAASFQNIVRIRLAVRARNGEYHSAPFTPRTQMTVRIAQGLTQQAVERIGAEILP